MMHRKYLAFTLPMACGCSRADSPRVANPAPAPAFASILDTTRWVPWASGAFAIKYPQGARLLPDTDRFSGFVGTAIRWDLRDHEWLRIAFTTVPTTSAATLARFVDSVRIQRNLTLNPDWRLTPANSVSIGGYKALQLQPDCGDCVAYEIYVALPGTWVVVSFSLEQNTPYTYKQQEQLYRAIVSTLQPARP